MAITDEDIERIADAVVDKLDQRNATNITVNGVHTIDDNNIVDSVRAWYTKEKIPSVSI